MKLIKRKIKKNRTVLNIFGIRLSIKNEKYFKNYMSVDYWVNFVEKVNGSQYANEGDSLYFLRDKTIFLKRFKEKLKRDFIILDECSYEDFVVFVKKHKKFAAKVKTGSSGIGVTIEDVEKYSDDLELLYTKLIEKKQLLLEEQIIQHEEINAFNPNSLSTIRICTLNIGGEIEIISYPIFRIGMDERNTNSEKVMMMKIHPETGVCIPTAIELDYAPNTLKYITDNIHPLTKLCVSNFKIPYFEEMKELVKESAKMVPEVTYIGWDVAITNDEPVIVEGNGGPYSYQDEQFFSIYDSNEGRKSYYDNLKDYIEFRKNATDKEIEAINKKLFIEQPKNLKETEFVIILGSEKCSYRAKQACETFKGLNPIFIASGGNKHAGKLECDVIKEVLVDNGINQENIIIEDESRWTRENLEHSFEIIKRMKDKQNKPKVAIVTAGFHSQRVNVLKKKYEKDFDINVVSAYGEKTAPDTWFKSLYGYNIILTEYKKTI